MKSRGFSLAEALIACALLCGISVCLLGVWGVHARATAQSRDLLVASAWAEQQMEEKLSRGYTVKTELHTEHENFKVKHVVEDLEIINEYRYATYVTDYAEPTNPGLKHVTVEVAWEHGGKWKSIKVTTRLSWQG